jgi:hypothetical protein
MCAPRCLLAFIRVSVPFHIIFFNLIYKKLNVVVQTEEDTEGEGKGTEKKHGTHATHSATARVIARRQTPSRFKKCEKRNKIYVHGQQSGRLGHRIPLQMTNALEGDFGHALLPLLVQEPHIVVQDENFGPLEAARLKIMNTTVRGHTRGSKWSQNRFFRSFQGNLDLRKELFREDSQAR